MMAENHIFITMEYVYFQLEEETHYILNVPLGRIFPT